MLRLADGKEKQFKEVMFDILCISRATNLSAYVQVEQFVFDSYQQVLNKWLQQYKTWCVVYTENGSHATDFFFTEVYSAAMMKHVYPMVNRFFQRPQPVKSTSNKPAPAKRPLESPEVEPSAKRVAVTFKVEEIDKMIEACTEQLKTLKRWKQMCSA